jgi:hypothetical protein
MNLNESLNPDGSERDMEFDEWLAQEKEANARSRKKTDAKWARRRAEGLFDYHGGLIPWHETEADRKAEISAQQNQATYPKICRISPIGGKRNALASMIELFAVTEDEISPQVVSMN